MVDIAGIDIPLWLCIVIPTLFLLYRYLTSTFDYFEKRNIPGPKPYPFFGTALGFFMKGSNQYDEHLRNTYGRVVGGFVGRTPELYVNDPEILKEILIKKFTCFQNHNFGVFVPEYPMKKMLTVIKFDHWKHVRNTLSPTFSGGKLRRMTGAVNKCARTLVSHMSVKMKKGEDMEIRKKMEHFTMDVIASTAFGLDTDCQANPENDFVVNGRHLLSAFSSVFNIRIVMMLLFPKLARLLGITIFPSSCIKFFTQALDHAMKSRGDGEKSAKDFAQLLADEDRGDPAMGEEDTNPDLVKTDDGQVYNKTGLTREEILASAMVFFLAGFDTTAAGLSFLVYNLACNPEQQQKLYEEIVEKMGDKKEPDYDIIKDMPYLHMCLEESLRLYPPANKTDRVCNEDVVINGMKLEKGLLIEISPWSIHRDPDLWPEPDKFIPERFTPEEKATREPISWIPFGHGPRNCIGMRLALMEIKFAVIHMLKEFRIITCDKTEIPPQLQSLAMKAKNGLYVKLEARD